MEAWDLLSDPSNPAPAGGAAVSAAQALVGGGSSSSSGNGGGGSAARNRRRKAYAIKVLDKVHILKEKKQKYVNVEKEALSKLIRHPGVVTLYWTFQDRESLCE